MDDNTHKTVLLSETVDGLKLKKNDTAIDATVGIGGHAEEIVKAIGKGTLLVIDVDNDSLALSKKRLADAPAKVIYIQGNFRNLKRLAHEAGVASAEGIVFDLGWRIEQLASGKGLSFRSDEPLLMNLSERTTLTAKDIIAGWDEEEIATMIREYGEERFAGRIARAIVEARKAKPIETARELSEIIFHSVPAFYKRGRLHPATKTFQALRIAVNDELDALTEGIEEAMDILALGGRLAVISFHSLEDRIVKNAFRVAEDNGMGMRVTKKPIVPSLEERKKNPRSRSAKLRIFEKKKSYGTD
ncbi:16S rRNA (cytosine(1402)-N(4))-methyltransferase RsmH [Candidatus Kaiserbacteria bacterium]|nr:16S rRNA (cytosine(1402)-N(4))-methyltransferase RsmH [Candidatus Kaiserbacteria bacterium]